jgi:hypothetical protein
LGLLLWRNLYSHCSLAVLLFELELTLQRVR